MTEDDRQALDGALVSMGLIANGDRPVIEPLAGGVSCDVFRVDLPTGPVCMKRALAKLKVEKDWFAPVERNAFEVAWMEAASAIVPAAVPEVVGHDPDAGLFAMTYLPPETHPVWKHLLRDGRIDPEIAGQLGDVMGQIHAATAGRSDIAERFADAAPLFHALRIEPYFLATGLEHPDCRDRVEALADRTETTRLTLVHGDFSPKNILAGPEGPVLLDAETGHYGDPAFDLAFCLNHLLLKCIWRPHWTDRYLNCFSAMKDAYLRRVDWERPAVIEGRIASLLPVLLLARIDGKSPVEYITNDAEKDNVRMIAKPLILSPPRTLADLAAHWREGLPR
ncbi:MAG: phosphotransferase family protein [Alphaproteobacteria bacterium]